MDLLGSSSSPDIGASGVSTTNASSFNQQSDSVAGSSAVGGTIKHFTAFNLTNKCFNRNHSTLFESDGCKNVSTVNYYFWAIHFIL